MSAWSEYKKKIGNTRPWDVINRNVEKASDELADKRMSICNDCDKLVKVTKQCKECGCFMALKTRLQNAQCPLNKW